MRNTKKSRTFVRLFACSTFEHARARIRARRNRFEYTRAQFEHQGNGERLRSEAPPQLPLRRELSRQRDIKA